MADAVRAWLRSDDDTIETRAGGVIVVDFMHYVVQLLRKIAGAK
jgi:hypothetical protein